MASIGTTGLVPSAPAQEEIAMDLFRHLRRVTVAGAVLVTLGGVAVPAMGTDASASPSIPPPPPLVAWTRVLDADLAGPGAQRIHGLAADGGVVLAWGETLVPIGPDAGDVDQGGATWRSTDGVEWLPSLVTDGVPSGDASWVTDVVHGPGGWVAIGYVCCGTEEPAVWVSADGTEWLRTAFPTAPLPDVPADRIDLEAIAAGPDGYVIAGALFVGGDRVVVPAVWSSPDGRTWAAQAAALGEDAGQLQDVAWDRERFVAVGNLGAPDAPDLDGLVLSSSDGQSWAPAADVSGLLAAPDDMLLTQVVPFAGGLLVTGARGDSADRLACLGRDCITFRSAAWISADGDGWDEVSGDVPSIVTARDDGLLGIDGRRLLASTDGHRWTAMPHEGGPVTDEVVETVVAWGDGLLAAGSGPDPLDGSEDGDGRLWRIAAALAPG